MDPKFKYAVIGLASLALVLPERAALRKPRRIKMLSLRI